MKWPWRRQAQRIINNLRRSGCRGIIMARRGAGVRVIGEAATSMRHANDNEDT